SQDETSRPDTPPKTTCAAASACRASPSPPSPTSAAHNRYRPTDADGSRRPRASRRKPDTRTPPATANRTDTHGTPPRSRSAPETPAPSAGSLDAAPRQATKPPGWSQPGTHLRDFSRILSREAAREKKIAPATAQYVMAHARRNASPRDLSARG